MDEPVKGVQRLYLTIGGMQNCRKVGGSRLLLLMVVKGELFAMMSWDRLLKVCLCAYVLW